MPDRQRLLRTRTLLRLPEFQWFEQVIDHAALAPQYQGVGGDLCEEPTQHSIPGRNELCY